MEEGFVVDESYGTRAPSHWVEGAAEKSVWMGLKLRGKRKLAVQAWRCTRCGLLESYAPE